MYITCQQCNTIFRLDENLVKATGSKVRCCQCRNVFVTYPPESGKVEAGVFGVETGPSAVPATASEATLDQELEGIDLAELDSILDHDHRFEDEASSGTVAEEDLGMIVGDDDVAELDEDDLDLDFTIEPEEESLAVEQPQAAQSDLDIDDLDLDMDFELDDGLDKKDAQITGDEIAVPTNAGLDSTSEAAQADDVTVSPDDLERELDELDLSLDDDEPMLEPEPAPEKEAGGDAPLLDEDIEFEEDTSEATALAAETPDEEPELTLEEESTSEPEAPEVASAIDEASLDDTGDLDLSDLDAILGLDDATDQAALDIPETSDDEDLELSLDDDSDEISDEIPGLELDEEPELGLDEEPVLELDEEPELELDEELTLELDDDTEEPELEMASDALSADGIVDEGDDLDLSDLDAMLEGAPEGPDLDEPEAEEADLELSLEDDAPAGEAEEDLEDLSFELDSEFEDEETEQEIAEVVAPAVEDEELDLSDIEQMLEGDDASEATGSDIDVSEGEKWAADDEVDLDDANELDLSDIEAAIDAADKDVVGERLDIGEEELSLSDEALEQTPDIELEDDALELELESDSATAEVEMAVEDDSAADELDLSDLGGLVEDQDASATTETIETGDIELEFEVSDQALQPAVEPSVTTEPFEAAETAETADKQTADLGPEFAIEDTMPAQVGSDLDDEEMAQPVKKKRSSKGLVFILILLLLGGAGYLFYAVSYTGLEIPYLSEYLNPKPKDPAGILNLATLDINSKFIESEKSGRLFVVTGKVRNGKDTARKMIRLQGKLFTTGKVLVKTEFTYAGVSLTDQEVSELPIADIKQQINDTAGSVSTIKTLSGQTVPFMVVFSDLPEGLDEFAIEVVSSSEAQ